MSFSDLKSPHKWFIPLSSPPFGSLSPIASGLVPLYFEIAKKHVKYMKIGPCWTSTIIYFYPETLWVQALSLLVSSPIPLVFR